MTQIELQALNAQIRGFNAISHSHETINWEQRRYETAKDLLAGFAASQRGISIEQDVPNAIRIADELIKKLKGV